jgi:hypothetical protein
MTGTMVIYLDSSRDNVAERRLGVELGYLC